MFHKPASADRPAMCGPLCGLAPLQKQMMVSSPLVSVHDFIKSKFMPEIVQNSPSCQQGLFLSPLRALTKLTSPDVMGS